MTNPDRVVYAATLEQAHLLKNALWEQGIFAHVIEGSAYFEASVVSSVVVDESDLEKARQIVADFEESRRGGVLPAELKHFNDEDGGDTRWPTCPGCGQPRHSSCPHCETAGTRFPEAFMPDEAGEASLDALLVICPTCDEPFSPVYARRCEWCGYRFADGRELPPAPPRDSELNPRALIVLVGVACAIAAAVAVFAQLAATR